MLKQVWAITHQQENIASHLKALSMLTNIEAICIGGSENEFRLLAKELSDFSAAVLQQTFELQPISKNASAPSTRHSKLSLSSCLT